MEGWKLIDFYYIFYDLIPLTAMTPALNLIHGSDEDRGHCFGIDDGIKVRPVAVYVTFIGNAVDTCSLCHHYNGGGRSSCTIGIDFDMRLVKDHRYLHIAGFASNA